MTTYYTSEHEWISVEGDVGTVGITAFAAEKLGDVVFVELPDAGKKVKKEGDMAVVESVKAASDVYAPVSGDILEANAAIVNGSHTGDDYRFRTESSVPIYAADEATGTPGCTVAQIESIRVTARSESMDGGVPNDLGTSTGDAGVANSAFRGTNVIEIIPTGGSNCLRAVAISGGPFLALPCRVEYDLSGSSRSSVFE